ncbi:hypothetical protein FUSO4_00725 [Fusobacterium necrophorum DJ-1]|uniref:Uncharacterized protein n=1 Tax=Fusobacterium necrophorum DJ-2 TaxID=1441737 RepID=A0AB73C0U7_9FUSO|nr:hypothetical protein FUSO4_00725 [Fusobacterium necrophorum DJ-1]KDE69936.1 hypothetical protein FUSO8_10770 [Fusobacterium necrophorum DJ-2]KDE70451.1 hypothetical protein FUSO6_04430 [Fusobacterium necrophorum DAB]
MKNSVQEDLFLIKLSIDDRKRPGEDREKTGRKPGENREKGNVWRSPKNL